MAIIHNVFDPDVWASVPFHFWTFVFFGTGCIVGSFLNVCIYRMPLGLSVVAPPSHCPHCKYSIPWYLNIPLVTWLYLGGRCRNCGASISPRYFLVELVTGVGFASCWIQFGHHSIGAAIVLSIFLAGLIVATFIDFEHFIIPDEITIGGMILGFVGSFLIPALHHETAPSAAMKQSLLGLWLGAGIVYLILRVGKLLFGRQKVALSGERAVIFTETGIELPDKTLAFEDIFYRKSDTITLQASRVELPDRCYRDVVIKLSPVALRIGEDQLDPETVPFMEAVTSQIVLPREAMGLGDVKFMGAIGAFLGWRGVVFSLIVSSFVGALVGLTLVLMRRRDLSSRLPYGPYLALAAALYMFAGPDLIAWYQRVLSDLLSLTQ